MVITGNDLRILEKLAAMCRSDASKRERGGAAWPSQDWLGEALGIRRETVCRRIRALAGAGYIRLYKVAAAGPWLRNVYRLTGAAYALL
jgi:DNA-binding Lrp family transcriptional regulator